MLLVRPGLWQFKEIGWALHYGVFRDPCWKNWRGKYFKTRSSWYNLLCLVDFEYHGFYSAQNRDLSQSNLTKRTNCKDSLELLIRLCCLRSAWTVFPIFSCPNNTYLSMFMSVWYPILLTIPMVDVIKTTDMWISTTTEWFQDMHIGYP